MVAKLLQTKQTFCMLFKAGGSYVTLLGETVCPLQVMEITTAEVLKECLLRNSGASVWSNNFKFKCRSVCADKAGSNAKAERSIAADRGDSWATLLCPCDIHITSTVHEKSFQGLLPNHISGLIHSALSLRHGAAMTIFRSCMRQEVRARLKIMHGRPPAAAIKYKERVFDLFFTSGGNALVKQVLLAGLPNGDWRNREHVEYYVTPGPNAIQDPEHIARLLEGSLCWILCESKPALWPRHRWCGADLSLDTIGRMEIVHGLLSATYKRVVGTYANAKVSGTAVSSTGVVYLGHMMDDDVGVLPICDDIGDMEEAVPDQPMGAAAAAADDAPDAKVQASTDDSWAAINAKDRKLTLQWLEQGPLACMMLMRQAMEPLRVLFHSQFAKAGVEWELHQRAEAARALARGGSDLVAREFRVLVAAEGKLENKLFEQLAQLFLDEGIWEVIPQGDLTVSFTCKAFRLLSRLGCAVEQLLAHPHRQFPICLFKLLRHPELAADFIGVSKCQKDAWTQSVEDAYPSLGGEEFMHILVAHANIQWTDISGVEARHASIRRQLMTRSIQTTTFGIADASAEWVFQNLRLMSRPRVSNRKRRQPRQHKKATHHHKMLRLQTPP